MVERPVSPRHPFPAFAREFGPRGWNVFCITDSDRAVVVHGVFCASLPMLCPDGRGLVVHVRTTPEAFGNLMREHAAVLDRHTKTCELCAGVLDGAVRRALASL
ncbi:hypothetical protein CLV63_11931 [Murinocardiopsis flavida]|uniref:Uncharacterized protein n=1 Tax=Murinocardiopsis flavida TaxID=645275 RepID=A0A2P8D3F1_9ACTN|nr:hypothetical protein [Murinocardiopsis flavida]PSK91750.1 hypothetical protein CLV63_11931 [Murinocardiopsis flavida]